MTNTPPGMKHIAWFCEHRDGTWNPEKLRTEKERPHYEARRKSDGTWKLKKRHEVLSAITSADLDDGRPGCPDAVPLFAVDADCVARFAVVELPEEHFAGDYALVHIEADEIQIDVGWIDSADDARKVAAALLRAADQLEKQLAEERGPDGGELDDGAAADRAHDAQVDRENGVL